MIKNPIHLRLTKFSHWQLRLFMVCLCERMYPNFALYCQQTDHDYQKIFKNILDLVWESLLVKDAKINFDSQLEKLEDLIPTIDENSPYSIMPAIDACEALSELVHSYLSGDMLEHVISISQISLKTIIDLETEKSDLELDEQTLKTFEPIVDELDIQWEIYRLINGEENHNIELIKGLRDEIREDQISNIGVFLTTQP